MRYGAGAILLIFTLRAQVMPSPAPIAQGVLIERDTALAGGEFSIRLDSFEVLRYRFDGHTAADRGSFPVQVSGLRPGERVEVRSRAIAGSLLRYASTVHAFEEAPRGPLGSLRGQFQSNLAEGFPSAFPFDDPLFARGDLTFSGIIAYLGAGHLVLHTRRGERSILLRADTRYLDNGALATPGALRPNMRVFIRAGRNLYDEFEGYQVVWGEILLPH